MHPMSPNSKVWKANQTGKIVRLTLAFTAKMFQLGWKKIR